MAPPPAARGAEDGAPRAQRSAGDRTLQRVHADLGFGRTVAPEKRGTECVHRRFRNRGTEYVSESGIKRMRGGAKRQRARALAPTFNPIACTLLMKGLSPRPPAADGHLSEQGLRLAQKMQGGPCTPVGIRL